MGNNNNFIAYEYKNITVKQDDVTIYVDCLSNFGWVLVDEHEQKFQPVIPSGAAVYTQVVNAVAPDHTNEGLETVALKFKRDRNINNRLEVNRLESRCVDALSSINGMERKSNAYTMGISLGTGIIGTVILAGAIHCFKSSNIVAGVLLAVLGFAGWGIGFFANSKVKQKKSVQTEPMVQEQLEIAYSACEQAHALLA
jgi:hypothetical protein